MIVHNQNEECVNESRIVRLEEKVAQTEKQQETHDTILKELNQNIQKLSEVMVSTQATLNTLKWVLTIVITAFGGIMIFLVTELIKIIH